ncbi:hypothetical protein [Brachybacterium sp. Z12]|uniref:hypothetical protein n=1 Tax=Brachybacterium sp. Z12 TaxID=2759167 RepID=UPI00223BC3ED|nr:hypothetical protein [Brachybacterium sp. Z12]
MVREGLLEHPVHGAHVLRHRQAGFMPVDLPHPGALARRRQLGELRRVDGAAHVQPGAHHRVARCREQPAAVGVQLVRVGVELGALHAACPGEGTAHLDRPVQQRSGQGVSLGGVLGEHELDVGAAGGSVLQGHPGDRGLVEGGEPSAATGTTTTSRRAQDFSPTMRERIPASSAVPSGVWRRISAVTSATTAGTSASIGTRVVSRPSRAGGIVGGK